MYQFPRDKSLDSSLALLSEGYRFIPRRCRRYQSDVFETRLMLRRAICTMGEDAARMFYYPDRFTRRGALPITALTLLQDIGSAAVLDGKAHRHRKQMFMSLMTPQAIQRLGDVTTAQWQDYIGKWENQDRVVLHDEAQEILCRAVCEWAGVPLTESEAKQRTREFGAMIDGAGAIGPRNWRGQLLRARTERWMRNIIEQVRSDRIEVTEGSAAHIIARHQDPDGKTMDTRTAAVELINVLRPTVAVARYVTFAALALHQHPECRGKLQADDEYTELFVQEVRRFYPFFPLVAGRVRNEFEWRGQHFRKGTWVLLDLYSTNHDPRSW